MFDKFRGNLKSKTMWCNALLTSFLAMAKSMEVEIPIDIVSYLFLGMNWILRQFTTGSIEDKLS